MKILRLIILLLFTITAHGQQHQIIVTKYNALNKADFIYNNIPYDVDTTDYDKNIIYMVNYLNYIRTNLYKYADSCKNTIKYNNIDIDGFSDKRHVLSYNDKLSLEAMNRAIYLETYHPKNPTPHIYKNNKIFESVGKLYKMSKVTKINDFDLLNELKAIIDNLVVDYPPYVVGHRNKLLTSDKNFKNIGIGYYYKTEIKDGYYYKTLSVFILISTDDALTNDDNFYIKLKDNGGVMTMYKR